MGGQKDFLEEVWRSECLEWVSHGKICWKFPSSSDSAKELKEKEAWYVPGIEEKLCGWSQVYLGENEVGGQKWGKWHSEVGRIAIISVPCGNSRQRIVKALFIFLSDIHIMLTWLSALYWLWNHYSKSLYVFSPVVLFLNGKMSSSLEHCVPHCFFPVNCYYVQCSEPLLIFCFLLWSFLLPTASPLQYLCARHSIPALLQAEF